jgi:hypothetical protein
MKRQQEQESNVEWSDQTQHQYHRGYGHSQVTPEHKNPTTPSRSDRQLVCLFSPIPFLSFMNLTTLIIGINPITTFTNDGQR